MHPVVTKPLVWKRKESTEEQRWRGRSEPRHLQAGHTYTFTRPTRAAGLVNTGLRRALARATSRESGVDRHGDDGTWPPSTFPGHVTTSRGFPMSDSWEAHSAGHSWNSHFKCHWNCKIWNLSAFQSEYTFLPTSSLSVFSISQNLQSMC